MTKRIFACLFLLLACACTKIAPSNIPIYPVYLELDLSFEDKDLIPIMAHKTITSHSQGLAAIEKTGFGGILMYHGVTPIGGTSYYAFDAACPHEAQNNVRVEVDNDGINAVCPKCGSKFNLLEGMGNPIEGPANTDRIGLRQYSVRESNNKIYVSN